MGSGRYIDSCPHNFADTESILWEWQQSTPVLEEYAREGWNVGSINRIGKLLQLSIEKEQPHSFLFNKL